MQIKETGKMSIDQVRFYGFDEEQIDVPLEVTTINHWIWGNQYHWHSRVKAEMKCA